MTYYSDSCVWVQSVLSQLQLAGILECLVLGAGGGVAAAGWQPGLASSSDGDIVSGDAPPSRDAQPLLRPPVQHVVIAAALQLPLDGVNDDLGRSPLLNFVLIYQIFRLKSFDVQ